MICNYHYFKKGFEGFTTQVYTCLFANKNFTCYTINTSSFKSREFLWCSLWALDRYASEFAFTSVWLILKDLRLVMLVRTLWMSLMLRQGFRISDEEDDFWWHAMNVKQRMGGIEISSLRKLEYDHFKNLYLNLIRLLRFYLIDIGNFMSVAINNAYFLVHWEIVKSNNSIWR